tara:strand:- start:119 stop:865 length:747 start_codon:yes stop_codon:yes gene_type:complete
MASLGVNIDHIAVVREARKAHEPDPVRLAILAEIGGADGITIHLREDRRHIQERDLRILRETVAVKLNLEMASTEEMIQIALNTKPDMVTLVPEKREEVTTEGGLDVCSNINNLRNTIDILQGNEIPVSLFIDPIKEQIDASQDASACFIELHTGQYAESKSYQKQKELAKIEESTFYSRSLGLKVNAGHGLTFKNVEPIAAIEGIEELNIGHSIIARAISTGLVEAVKDMKNLIQNPRRDLFIPGII